MVRDITAANGIEAIVQEATVRLRDVGRMPVLLAGRATPAA